jgi:transposase-like protein
MRKRHTAEQVIGLLRQAEVELAQGRSVGEICRGLGVSEASYYRWRSEYGGLKVDQARRLKELERENARLKRAVAELTLDKLILKEAAEGNFQYRSAQWSTLPAIVPIGIARGPAAKPPQGAGRWPRAKQ